MIQTVGIVGLGALGIMYARELQRTLGRESVMVIADAARVERYRREGVFANGEPCDFRYVTGAEARPVDLLIFTTKYMALADAAAMARSACGPDTIVMSFLNGVTSEQVLDEVLHPAHLLYSTVQGMDATKEGNHVSFWHVGSVAFNGLDEDEEPSVRAVAELLGRSAITPLTPADIVHQLWGKWMLNVGVNQVCAVYGVPLAGVQPGGGHRDEMLHAMREAQAVARAEGIELSDEEFDAWTAIIDSLSPEGEPSMRQDMKAGRPTEVGLFAAKVCELGRRHGIPTPLNDSYLAQLP